MLHDLTKGVLKWLLEKKSPGFSGRGVTRGLSKDNITTYYSTNDSYK